MNNEQVLSTTGANSKQILESIAQQIWAARRLTQKNLRNESEQAFRKVAEYARENHFHAESLIAQGAIYELRERFEEAMWYLEQAIDDPSNHLKGIAFFFLGSVYIERFPAENTEKQEEAIKCYKGAIEHEAFDKKNWAHNNLANIYFRQKKYLEAHKHYEACLQFEDNTHYITFYNQGRLALAQKDFLQAITKLESALNEAGDDYDMRGACYRERGTAYIIETLDVLKNVEESLIKIKLAIESWEKAKTEFDKYDERVHNQIGKSGKAAVAVAKIRIANGLVDKNGIKKPEGDDDVLLRWWPPEETGPDGYSTPEERIFSQIEAIGQDRYRLYNSKNSSRFAASRKGKENIPPKNVLAILRGWGSATPLIEDASSPCLGGGYFLKWRDKGLIIDPGIDFLYNFRASGFHMREVDAVVVSHDHTDHNFDLMAIDDVFYEMSRRAVEDKATKQWSYSLFCDEQTERKEFLKDKAPHRHLLGLDENRCERSPNNEESIDLRKREKLPFRIHYFKVQHGKYLPAFGMRVECFPAGKGKPIVIGFTCDTQHFVELEGHLKECDILVAHVSQPTLAELLTSDNPKKNHLGYRGVAKLVRNCKPKLTIIGEFWAGFADMRIDIAKGLKRINDNAAIIPSSIGLFIDPETGEVECTNCKEWTPAANIHVTAANEEFGPLGYICPLCRMNP
jgi:tetratricopeptide (TPR) repeat protein/ribonuclease BN (tRNA processing enzyme)